MFTRCCRGIANSNLLVHRHLNPENASVKHRRASTPHRYCARTGCELANQRSIAPLFSIRLIMRWLYACGAFRSGAELSHCPALFRRQNPGLASTHLPAYLFLRLLSCFSSYVYYDELAKRTRIDIRWILRANYLIGSFAAEGKYENVNDTNCLRAIRVCKCARIARSSAKQNCGYGAYNTAYVGINFRRLIFRLFRSLPRARARALFVPLRVYAAHEKPSHVNSRNALGSRDYKSLLRARYEQRRLINSN